MQTCSTFVAKRTLLQFDVYPTKGVSSARALQSADTVERKARSTPSTPPVETLDIICPNHHDLPESTHRTELLVRNDGVLRKFRLQFCL